MVNVLNGGMSKRTISKPHADDFFSIFGIAWWYGNTVWIAGPLWREPSDDTFHKLFHKRSSCQLLETLWCSCLATLLMPSDYCSLWLTFYRHYFERHFPERKCLYFDVTILWNFCCNQVVLIKRILSKIEFANDYKSGAKYHESNLYASNIFCRYASKEVSIWLDCFARDYFVNAPSQWETALQCNINFGWAHSQNDPCVLRVVALNVCCIKGWVKQLHWCWPLWSLTHWGRDNMAAISQTIFSSAFSWIKMYKFRLSFHWSLFPRVQSTIFQHGFI